LPLSPAALVLPNMNANGDGLLRIFLTYLRLGCISFGGPVAHLGYYREEFVLRRKWLSESDYAGLIALCQSVPGPSSSQLGFCIGWLRGGFMGALVAWLGFTLPSAILMTTAAYGLFALGESSLEYLHGLLVAAVAVVAKAIFGMAKSLCPDLARGVLAIAGAILALLFPGNFGQLSVVIIGVLAGLALYLKKEKAQPAASDLKPLGSPKIVIPTLVIFALLLIASSFIPSDAPGAMAAKHYQSGALVFGGGHVVLPLLNESIVTTGLVPEPTFLAAYGIVQAMPGPLFTISAFTGTVASGNWLGGLTALIAIFLPGMLLVTALMPIWHKYRNYAWARAALSGANAAVVGLLVAALITPVWAEGIRDATDLLLALAAFIALQGFKLPPWAVILACGLTGALV
jgi:chromate transporter